MFVHSLSAIPLAKPVEQLFLQVVLGCMLSEPAVFLATEVQWGAITHVVDKLH